MPSKKPSHKKKKFKALENESLITFLEAKSLVVYPMLIAQFIGIVHELLPGFLEEEPPDDFSLLDHFYPSLVSLGYLHGTCWNIVKGFPVRNIHIGIVGQFDRALSRLGNEGNISPLPPAPTQAEDIEDDDVVF